ncbi:MAG: PD40 domain-containing protein [Ardenticatenaceae bacterium]|nr:PD40 domain-containing protein [Ardenticatenaceae bacterium]MCB9444735.1 PD40 domain-containing protein [Ardenticatenaceae bacterium]
MSRWWILFVGIMLAACTAVAKPTPAPQIVETETVEGERPLATPIPPAPPQSTAFDQTITPTIETTTEIIDSTATEPSNFPQSPTLTPTATPIPGISLPILSSLGQLAYIQDQVLYVESKTGSNEFQAMDSFVETAVWSPDGTKLLYTSNSAPGRGASVNDHRIWLSSENINFSLAEQIVDFPTPPYVYPAAYPQTDYIKWLPDSNRILFFGLVPYEEEHAEYFATISLVDLEKRSIDLLNDQFDAQRDRILSVTDTNFLIITHCGAPCKMIAAYDYTGQSLWDEPWGTAAGLFAITPNRGFIIDAGYSGGVSSTTGLAKIDIVSRDFTIIWEPQNAPNNDYFRFIAPQISPDNKFISFNRGPWDDYPAFNLGRLYVIDQNGRTYGQLENGLVLDWRPTGGLVATQSLDDGTNQLIYWPLDGTANKVFVPPYNFSFKDGKWSPDGQYFAFNALDESIGASYLYVWHLDSNLPNLIQVTTSVEAFDNFTWLPDSSSFYFNLGNQALWQFKIGSAESKLIATE